MRRSILLVTFALPVLALFVCGCEKKDGDSENFGKNILPKTVSDSTPRQFQDVADFLALIDSSDEIQVFQNPRYKKEKEVQITLDKPQTETLSERFSTMDRNDFSIKDPDPGKPPSHICEFVFKKDNRVLAKIKYYIFGRVVLENGDTWQTNNSLYSDKFIQSMGFYIPYDRKWKCRKEIKVTSKNSIFKNLVATLRAGSSFKEANTSSIRLFSFLPSLGLTQIFLTKAIFRGSLKPIPYR